MILAEKRTGETPLECLERVRAEQVALGHIEYAEAPMTYAGRLDPLASGILPILVGEECKDKEKYLGADKEYEIEILFGVETDTGDLLGLIQKTPEARTEPGLAAGSLDLSRYVGRFLQEYPAYSSKTVGGTPLHALTRAGDLPEEMPTKEVEIYDVETLGEREVSASDILTRAEERIALVQGNFRQEDILNAWRSFASPSSSLSSQIFKVVQARVRCSSGAYMRALAVRIGRDAGSAALAFDIKRTKVFI